MVLAFNDILVRQVGTKSSEEIAASIFMVPIRKARVFKLFDEY
jgi:hypothetical protein